MDLMTIAVIADYRITSLVIIYLLIKESNKHKGFNRLLCIVLASIMIGSLTVMVYSQFQAGGLI